MGGPTERRRCDVWVLTSERGLGGVTPEKFLKSYLKNGAFACILGAENRIDFHPKKPVEKVDF